MKDFVANYVRPTLLFTLFMVVLLQPGRKQAVPLSSFLETRSLDLVLDGENLGKTYICDKKGRALPVLFVAGRNSAGTTLQKDVESTLWPASHAPDCGQRACKENHHFDLQDEVSGKTYNELWGECSEPKSGLVADFTPGIIYWHHHPRDLRKIYGNRSQELVFVLGLKEPFQRMLSAYLDLKTAGLADAENFEEHVRDFLKKWESHKYNLGRNHTPREGRTVDEGIYHYQIRRFIQAGFSPSQFIVYPNSMYAQYRDNLDTNPVLEAVRRKLGKEVLRPEKGQPSNPPLTGPGDALPLEEACPDAALRNRMEEEVFAPANKLLFELLAEQVGNGMVLVNYEGQANDVAAVTEWLTSRWKS